MSRKYSRRMLAISAAAVLLTGCDPVATGPTLADGTLAELQSAPVTLEWQATARSLVATNNLNPLVAARIMAALGRAQDHAVQAADAATAAVASSNGAGYGAGGRARYESRRGAVAGASVRVLGFLVPSAATALEQKLAEQGNAGPGGVHPEFTRGVALGRAEGDVVVQHLMTDRFTAAWNGTVPVGPGLWTPSAMPPAGGMLGQVEPFFLTSPSQFRPAPPPAYLSPEFNADLAEVLAMTSTATPAQIANAQWWNFPLGTYSPVGFWNELAGTYAAEAGLDEAATARVFALASAAVFDALIACFEAKYHYWTLRPTQANPAITLAYGLPNYPAYPSGHQSVSSSAARVLTHFFPAHAADIEALRAEASESRIIGGIHYRFDMNAARIMGEAVADWVLTHAGD